MLGRKILFALMTAAFVFAFFGCGDSSDEREVYTSFPDPAVLSQFGLPAGLTEPAGCTFKGGVKYSMGKFKILELVWEGADPAKAAAYAAVLDGLLGTQDGNETKPEYIGYWWDIGPYVGLTYYISNFTDGDGKNHMAGELFLGVIIE